MQAGASVPWLARSLSWPSWWVCRPLSLLLVERPTVRAQAGQRPVLLAWQWLFLVTLFGSLLLLSEGLMGALAFWLAYLAFRLVMAIGLRLLRRSG